MYSLVGVDGNAYAIMGYVQRAMKEQNFTKEEVSEYLKNATSGNYNHLLRISSDALSKCNESAGIECAEWVDEFDY